MDVETNPGPCSETSSTLSQNSRQMFEERFGQMLHIMTVQTTGLSKQMEQHFFRLGNVMTKIQEEMETLNKDVIDNRTNILQLQAENSDMQQRLENMEKTIDRLETTARETNLKFFGIYENDRHGNTADIEEVVAALNYCSPQSSWKPKDIEKTHRLGRPTRGNKYPRPLIVTFRNLKDKLFILRDREMRDNLRQEGVKVAADLTPRQRETTQYYKDQGKLAFYKNGRLHVEDNFNQESGHQKYTKHDTRTARYVSTHNTDHANHGTNTNRQNRVNEYSRRTPVSNRHNEDTNAETNGNARRINRQAANEPETDRQEITQTTGRPDQGPPDRNCPGTTELPRLGTGQSSFPWPFPLPMNIPFPPMNVPFPPNGTPPLFSHPSAYEPPPRTEPIPVRTTVRPQSVAMQAPSQPAEPTTDQPAEQQEPDRPLQSTIYVRLQSPNQATAAQGQTTTEQRFEPDSRDQTAVQTPEAPDTQSAEREATPTDAEQQPQTRTTHEGTHDATRTQDKETGTQATAERQDADLSYADAARSPTRPATNARAATNTTDQSSSAKPQGKGKSPVQTRASSRPNTRSKSVSTQPQTTVQTTLNAWSNAPASK